MPAAEKSALGLAKQTGVGTPNVTDADFDYLLFTAGSIGVNNVATPLDQEVGGGAMSRDVVKTGVFSAGKLACIPRPHTLGLAMLGATGSVASVDGVDGSWTHTFKMGTDQFAAPYFTARQDIAGLQGEQFQDLRFASIALNWRGGQFVRGEYGFLGGLPTPISDMAAWNAAAAVDGGPQFLAPLGDIELPTGTDVKVMSGMFAAGLSIPLDEQWIVGSYSPDALDIVQRAFAVNFVIKMTDAVLYEKINYDPAAGGAWAAEMFKEGNFKLEFSSPALAAPAKPYKFTVAGNGSSGAAANVAWSAQPIQLQAGKNVMMAVTGTFLADPAGGDPITMTLVNQTDAY